MLIFAVDRFISETPILSWAVAVIVAITIEVSCRKTSDRNRITNDLLNIGNGFALCAVAFVFLPWSYDVLRRIVNFAGGGFIDIRIQIISGIPKDIVSAIIFLFLYDSVYYWWHRVQHNTEFFWRIHRYHHSDEQFGATTFLRQHWIEMIAQTFIVMIPLLIVFKMNHVESWIITSFVSGWSFLTHLDVRFNLYGYSWILTGPQLHRMHHSPERSRSNSNFAAYFPIWDIVFGTYIAPVPDEFGPTGLADKLKGKAH